MGYVAAAKALTNNSGEANLGYSTLRSDCYRERTGGAERRYQRGETGEAGRALNNLPVDEL